MTPVFLARLFNISGGSLTLIYLLFPWLIIDQGPGISIFSSANLLWIVPWLVLAGAILSFLTRYGGLLTTLGVTIAGMYSPGPHSSFFPIAYSFEPGFWLAWVGGIVSLLGVSSNHKALRFRLPRLIRWVLPPLGTLLAVFGGLLVYAELIGPVSLSLLAKDITVPVTGVVILFVGLTRGSDLVDRHPEIG